MQELSSELLSFLKPKSDDQSYVDTSDLLFELAKTAGKYYLKQPREFGKSPLISAFQSLFKEGTKTLKAWL